MHRITTLENGLKVVTNNMPDMHSASVGLWIKTGGRYETERKNGISHFMEHMLFKGTARRSCQALKEAIEEKGGIFNAFTAEEFVCYYVKILSRHIGLAVDVLADMILNPSLKPEDVEKERLVIFEEIRMYLDLPMQYVHDLLDELIWPRQPLGFSLLGTYETVKSIDSQDLRRQKELFHNPNNIVAVCCGNIQHDDFVKMVATFFGDKKDKPRISFEKAHTYSKIECTRFFHKDTEQTHICLGVQALSRRHPDRYAIALLNIILGGNMSSRLFNEIREKRSLAYEIASSVKQYYDTGSFVVHAGIDNKKVKDAISVIMKQLGKIKNFPVTKKEFSMAKEYYKSGLLMALEDNMAAMMFFGEQMTAVDRITTKEEILKKLDEIEIDKLKEIAKAIFVDEALRLAVIGPQAEEDKEAIAQILHL